MPSLVAVARGDRETVELHAPWWSDAKDERGRYVERAVVYAVLTVEDEEWIQRQIMPSSMKAQRNPVLEMGESTKTSRYTLQRMLVELTDSEGRAQALDMPSLARLPRKDATWLLDELNDRNDPPVKADDRDDAEAAGNRARGLDDDEHADAEGVAVRHFRGRRAADGAGVQAG